MLAGKYSFAIEQGQDWARRIAWYDSTPTIKNLSAGWTATLKIRYYPGDVGTALLTITQADEITLATGVAGYNIILKLTAAVTAALTFQRGYYTLELIETVEEVVTSYRVLEGEMFVLKECTN